MGRAEKIGAEGSEQVKILDIAEWTKKIGEERSEKSGAEREDQSTKSEEE